MSRHGDGKQATPSVSPALVEACLSPRCRCRRLEAFSQSHQPTLLNPRWRKRVHLQLVPVDRRCNLKKRTSKEILYSWPHKITNPKCSHLYQYRNPNHSHFSIFPYSHKLHPDILSNFISYKSSPLYYCLIFPKLATF